MNQMDEHERLSEASEEASRPESPEEQELLADPWAVGTTMDADDTLELLRDALSQGMDIFESLSATERTMATAQAGLQTLSYDMHVKLGMELLALRRQEANLRLDAEQFGEQLKRRAFVRDMLKRVAKEDNWVQYPASDLERINRALDRSASKIQKESDNDGGADKSSMQDREPPSYARWLERRRKPNASNRTAFGTTLGSKPPKKKVSASPPINGGLTSQAVEPAPGTGLLGPDIPETAPVTTFGLAPRLMGPVAGPSKLSLSPGGGSHRVIDLNRVRVASGGGTDGLEAAQAEGTDGDHVEDAGADGSTKKDGGAISRASTAAQGDSEGHHAVRFLGDDDFMDDDGRQDLEDAAELLGLGGGGGGRESRRGCRPHSRMLVATDGLGSMDSNERVSAKPDWRSVLRKKRAAAFTIKHGSDAAESDGTGPDASDLELTAVDNPFLALRLSIKRELSQSSQRLRAPLTEDEPDAPAAEEPASEVPEVQDEDVGFILEVRAPLGVLEEAVKSLQSFGDDKLRAYVTALEAAAEGAAEAREPASTAAAVALLEVEEWAKGAAQRLETAREEYSMAHMAKLESITSVLELNRQVELLRGWLASMEQKRLAAAAATLTAQRERLSAATAAAGSGGLANLLEKCDEAVEELDSMAAAVEAAASEAEAQLEERERRRAALRLIEEECVKLAEEMAAREETDRLTQIMEAEAEAERLMAEAKDEGEARRHALKAAMLMGQEEWVLEKEARLAALRAAERDEKRVSMLRAAEEEKSLAAAAAGRSYNDALLKELIELEQAARAEAQMRRQRLEEALAELTHFDEMLQREQEGSTAVRAGSDDPALVTFLPAGVSAEALVRAAVEALRECGVVAAAAIEAAEAMTPETGEDEVVEASATGSGRSSPEQAARSGGKKDFELDQAGRTAQARLTAARSGLEAVVAAIAESRRAGSFDAALTQPSSSEPPSVAATEATLKALSTIAAASAEIALVTAAPALPASPPRRSITQTASIAPRDSAALKAAKQDLEEEQARIAAIVADAGERLGRRSSLLLQGLVDDCSSLAAAVAVAAEAAAEAPEASLAPSAAVSTAGEVLEAEVVSVVERRRSQLGEGAKAADGGMVTPEEDTSGLQISEEASAVMAAAEVFAPSPRARSQSLVPSTQPKITLPPGPLSVPLATSLPSPTSPNGALGPPVLRSRVSGAGISATTLTIGLSPRNDLSGTDWTLRPDPHTAASSNGVAQSGGGVSSVLLGGGGSMAPPPLPAVHPHSLGGAARSSQVSHPRTQNHHNHQTPHLHINQQQHTNHQGGLVGPYSRTSPQQQQQLHPPQVVLPVVSSSETAGSVSRRSLIQPRLGPVPGPAAALDFLPPIASHSLNGAGTALAAPPPTPRGIMFDGTSAGAAQGAPSPSSALLPPNRSSAQHQQQQPQQQQQSVPSQPQQPQQFHQQQLQHQRAQQQPQVQQTLWAGAAMERRGSRSLPVSPEPSFRSMPARSVAAARGGGGGAAGAAATRQSSSFVSQGLSAPLSAPGPHGAGDGRRGRGTASPSSPHRSASQDASSHTGRSSPSAVPSVLMIGDMSYSQWVSSQQHFTPRALEAARHVDEVLARLPPDLHSVLLNAAELLTMDKGGYEPVQIQSMGAGAGGGDNGKAFLPAHLQALPPVVSRYVFAQLQRIFQKGILGPTGNGSSGPVAGRPSGASSTVADAAAAETDGLDSEQSLAALELLHQWIPTVAQRIGEVRKVMSSNGGSHSGGSGASAAGGSCGGGGSGAAPTSSMAQSTVGFEVFRCPIGTGAMHGSPLRSSRKIRGTPPELGDGICSSHSSASSSASAAASAAAAASVSTVATVTTAGSPPGARVRHHILSLSTQVHPAGGKTGAGANRRSGTGFAPKPRKGSNVDPRHQNSSDMERWTIRGVNVQPLSKAPGAQQQQQEGPAAITPPTAYGGGPAAPGTAAGSARVEGSLGGVQQQREAFLPPLANKLTAVRH